MKKTWITPELKNHGAAENLTQQQKTFGSDDGIVLIIPGVDSDIAIGSL
ncbi:MAG: hypothetical protein AAF215_27630 [Cyanobacteria bacterium P01_A01_bin.123]